MCVYVFVYLRAMCLLRIKAMTKGKLMTLDQVDFSMMETHQDPGLNMPLQADSYSNFSACLIDLSKNKVSHCT